MLSRVLLAAVSAVTLTACEMDAGGPSAPPSATPISPSMPVPPNPTSVLQTWVCGREYSNHAWGYQRHGVVFDASGAIYTYKTIGQNEQPWNPADLSRLTEADLKMRYNGAMAISGKRVNIAEIEKYVPLIGDAARGKISEPRPHGADMGQTVLYCLHYDARTQTYAQVMLDNKGDVESTNTSQAAQNLRSWVNSWIGDLN